MGLAFLSPAYFPRADGDALVKFAGLHRLLESLLALAKRCENGRSLAFANMIFFAKLKRVHSDRISHVFDHGLEREESLSSAVSTIGAAHRQIGITGFADELDIFGLVIERQGLGPAVADDREGVGAVGAGVGEGIHVERIDDAVLFNSGP